MSMLKALTLKSSLPDPSVIIAMKGRLWRSNCRKKVMLSSTKKQTDCPQGKREEEKTKEPKNHHT